MHLIGRARDIVTPRSGGTPIACDADSFEVQLKPDRTIVAIAADPIRPGLSRLVGERGGGRLRQMLEEIVPEERRHATPLYLILDDLSGVSLVAGWAWSQWNPNWLVEIRAAMNNPELAKAFPTREGVCIGFAPGSAALSTESFTANSNHSDNRLGTPAPDLRHPDDPEGWHDFTVQDDVGMRRARRIDVWLDDVIVIDSAFQDSASTPAGGRAVIHEYRLNVTADPHSLRILSIDAEPRVLPHAECTAAPLNLTRLIDTPLSALRERVLAELRGTAGCTHLNDALRALAEVPVLLKYLPNSEHTISASRVQR